MEAIDSDLLEVQGESLFRFRPFRHYWIARVSSIGAYQMQVVATGWSVYELTHSPWDLGIVGLVQFLPRIALTLWAGAVADRHDRRWIASICTLVQMLACGLLAFGNWAGFMTRDVIFALIATIGAARAFEMPTMQSLLPSVLSAASFSRGLAMSTAATQIAIICGPALAGLIFFFGGTAVYNVATAG